MQFYTTCVDCPKDEIPLLETMCDSGVQITRRTFLKHVDREEIREIEKQLGYDRYGGGLTMARDWAVAYFKGWWGERRCVYFVWSAIEYVFVEED